jgi:nucleoside-diphosphate-sugar epimerase
MKVLVTGGTGFIGSHLVDALVKRGYDVRCLVRKTSRVDFLNKLNVELIYGDIMNMYSLEKAVEDADVVYHLAGGGDVSAISKEGYVKLRNLNARGTENLLKACSLSDIRKFILFSSVSAIGVIKDIVVDEKTSCKPETPHELANYESEQIALKYCQKNKIPLVIIRPTHVYGPRDVKEILKMCKLIKKHIFPIIGRGDNVLPIVYVENLVQATILAGERKSNINEIYIITDEEHTINEIVHTIAKELDIKIWGEHIPLSLAKIGIGLIEYLSKIFNITPPFNLKREDSITSNRLYNISKAKKELGYEPKVDLTEGIKRTINWYKQNGYLSIKGTQNMPIKSLYPLALAEGEGLGTAYEYFAKWNLLRKIFEEIGFQKNILVAGLPEKYGSSMDFVLLAQKYNSGITIIDERIEAIHKFKKTLQNLNKEDHSIRIIKVGRLSELKFTNSGKKYDLLLCCEVLQRLSENSRVEYFKQITKISKNAIIFVPNKENKSHAKLSGLNTLSLNELIGYCREKRSIVLKKGYIDMPPFPPGLKRAEEARSKATKSLIQKFFMKILEIWCSAENLFPKVIKKKKAHIVYVHVCSD